MHGDHVEHGQLLIHRDHLDALRAAGLDSLDALMAVPGDAVLDKRGLARWRQRVVLHVGSRTLFLKRYLRPPIREQIAQRLRGFTATAELEWHWLHRLSGLGLGTPTPVAWGAQRSGWREVRSVLVTAQVPGRSMERWVADGWPALADDVAARRRVILAVADLVATLHRANLFHRDLYLSHLYLSDASNELTLSLIDLQRVIQPRLRSLHLRIKDLAALHFSTPPAAATRADRLRGFLRYRGVPRLRLRDRLLLRAVLRKARRIARHTRHLADRGVSG